MLLLLGCIISYAQWNFTEGEPVECQIAVAVLAQRIHIFFTVYQHCKKCLVWATE